MVKKLPASEGDTETWIQSLGREDPLEEEMATHCSIHARIIQWTEGRGRLQSIVLQKSGTQLSEHPQMHNSPI